MSKLRKTILIVGILIVAVAASLGTALALYATGSMKTDPIELVYLLREPEAKEYDGTPLKLDDPLNDIMLKEGKLSAGHYAQIELLGSQTDVGTSMSDAKIEIFNEDGFKVTSDYSIKVVGAPLTVYPKTISVELPAQKVVYNGSKVLFNEYKISDSSEGDLCSGHKIYGSTDAELLNVGDTLPEDLTPLIFDVAGKDVTANYDIVDFIFDGIEVVPRPITVRPVSHEKIYDGRELVADGIEFVEGSLVEGQTCEYDINEGYNNFITDVDEIETQITALRIYDVIDGERVEVTENYEFNLQEYTGCLKITPRPLIVTAKSETFVYNGEEQSLVGDTEALSVEGLAETDEFIGVTYFGSRTTVGVTENAIAEVNIKGPSENYDIRRISGTIEITPRELLFKTHSAEKYYDGDPLESAGRDYELVNDNHIIEIDGDGNLPSITDAGEISNAYTVSIVDTANGNADCTANYAITYEYGTLKVKILPVKVTLQNSEDNREKVSYDGKTHSPALANADYFSVEPVLPDGEEADCKLGYADFEVVAETRAMRNAGEYYYTVKFKDKEIEERKRYSNYELFVPENGVLEITPLPLSVTLKEYVDTADSKNAFMYSGKAVKITVADAIENIALGTGAILPADVALESLITKWDFSIVADEILDAGTDYTYGVKITDSNLAANFDVKISGLADGASGVNITVKPMEVTVKLTDVERTYDGVTQTVDVDETVCELKRTEPLPAGEDINELAGLTKYDLKVDFTDGISEHTNADEYGFVVSAIKKKAQSNYNFTIESAEDNERAHAFLKINPKKVTVTIDDATIVYGDTVMPASTFALDCGELPNGETLTFTAHLENADGEEVEPEIRGGHILLNAGSYRNMPGDDKAIVGGNEKMTNYQFDFGTGGKFTVKPCPVTITTGSATKVYDGSVLRRKVATADFTLFGGQVIVCPDDAGVPSITDVDKIDNEFEIDIKSGTTSVKSNYLITNVWGTLEINHREITIATGSAEKVYDGTPLACDDPEVENAVFGHTPRISQPFSVTNATGTDLANDGVANQVEYTIFDRAGNDVGKNYKIEYVNGTLKVYPVAATVALNDFSDGIYESRMTYDGKVKQFTVAEAVEGITVDGIRYALEETKTEGAGIAFTADDFVIEYSEPIKGFGKYAYTLCFKDEDFSKNFNIAKSQLTSTVRVKKKAVVIEVKSYPEIAPFTYDNKVKELDINDVVLGITDTDGIAVAADLLSVKDLTVDCPEELLNAGEYKYKVKIDDDALAKNFLYTEPEGDVIIDKFGINVSLADYTETYSGVEFVIPEDSARIISKLGATEEEKEVEALILPEEDFAYVAADGRSIVNAGTYRYEAVLTDETKARNFNVTIVGGTGRNATVEIEQLQTTVTLNALTFTFNGKEQSIDGEAALNIGNPLLTADDFSFTAIRGGVETVLLKSGKYSYEAKLLNDNFTITGHRDGVVGNGEIEVEKYKTKVTLDNLTKEYDGEEYDFTTKKTVVIIDGKEYTLMQSPIASVEGELYTKENFKLVYADVTGDNPAPDHTNAGDYEVLAKLGGEFESFNEDVEIETVNGFVGISKKTVTLITQSESFVYNGNAHSAPDAELVGAVSGHFARAVEEGDIKPVSVTNVSEGAVLNKSAYKIYAKTVNSDGSESEIEVTGNYVIDEENSVYGELTVTPTGLTVHYKADITKPYMGQNGNISVAGGDVIDSVENDKFAAGDFAVVFDEEVINAGTYEFTVVLKDAAVNANYAISEVGSLTVTARELNVMLNSYKGVSAKEYTGEVQSVTAADVKVDTPSEGNPDAVAGGNFSFDYSGVMLNAGMYTYGVQLTDETLRGNYSVTFERGEYEIVPAKITVTLQNYEKTYNGTTFTVDILQAVTAIKDGAGNDSKLVTKNDFTVKYNQELRLANNYFELLTNGETYEGDIYTDEATGNRYKVLTAQVYTYEAELKDNSQSGNFAFTFVGGEFKINKRLLTFTATNMYMSKQFYEDGGYADSWELEVKDCVSISPNTPLADGDQLKIISALAEKEFSDSTEFKLYTLDCELTNNGCYEFTNVNGKVDAYISVQLITY